MTTFSYNEDTESANAISHSSQKTSQVVTLQPGPGEGKDIWTTSVYSYTGLGGGPGGGLDNHELQVGGWGDLYYSLIEFDLTDMPSEAVSARIELYAFPPGGDGAPGIFVDRITEFWDWRIQGTGADRERLWWADRPNTEQWLPEPLPPPVENSWYTVDITALYEAWQDGSIPNHGVQLRPTSNNRQWAKFYSSDYLDDPQLRPKLVVETSPDCCDYPVGSGDCLAEGYALSEYRVQAGADFLDPEYPGQHTGEDWNRGSGDEDYGDPVCSIGDGEVVESASYAGWSNIVLIRHELTDGLLRWSQYAHLAETAVTVGETVRQGQKVGTIGKQYPNAKCISKGPKAGWNCAHLHFEIRKAELAANQWPNSRTAIEQSYLDPSDMATDSYSGQGFIESTHD